MTKTVGYSEQSFPKPTSLQGWHLTIKQCLYLASRLHFWAKLSACVVMELTIVLRLNRLMLVFLWVKLKLQLPLPLPAAFLTLNVCPNSSAKVKHPWQLASRLQSSSSRMPWSSGSSACNCISLECLWVSLDSFTKIWLHLFHSQSSNPTPEHTLPWPKKSQRRPSSTSQSYSPSLSNLQSCMLASSEFPRPFTKNLSTGNLSMLVVSPYKMSNGSPTNTQSFG